MSRDKQLLDDLIEIFDDEYERRRLITPQNTAEKLNVKGYRKASEVALEVIAEIEKINKQYCTTIASAIIKAKLAELKKKYTEGEV